MTNRMDWRLALIQAAELVERLHTDPDFGDVEVLNVTVDDETIKVDYVNRNRAGVFHRQHEEKIILT